MGLKPLKKEVKVPFMSIPEVNGYCSSPVFQDLDGIFAPVRDGVYMFQFKNTTACSNMYIKLIASTLFKGAVAYRNHFFFKPE